MSLGPDAVANDAMLQRVLGEGDRRRVLRDRRRSRAQALLVTVAIVSVTTGAVLFSGRRDHSRQVVVGAGSAAPSPPAGPPPASTDPKTGASLPAIPSAPPTPGLIAFAGFSNISSETGVWIVRSDGSGLRRVDPHIPGCAQGGMGALRPDRGAVLFAPGRSCGLMEINVDGTGLRTIDKDGNCLFGCDWSPDGQSFVYQRGSNLIIAAVTGNAAPTVIGPGSAPSWSRDGTTIAYMPANGKVALYNVATRKSRPITATRQLWYPSFAPDGSHLAVSGNLSGLFTVGVADGVIKPVCVLAGATAADPAWSPDGKSLAFDDTTPALGVCDLATGQIRRLPSVGYSSQKPSWR